MTLDAMAEADERLGEVDAHFLGAPAPRAIA